MRLHHRWVAVAALVTCLGLVAAADKEEKVKISKEAQLLIDLANDARTKAKLKPVKANALLGKAATGYSEFMIKHATKAREMMEKSDPKVHELDGKNIGKRLDDVTYDWSDCGENVAVAFSLEQMKQVHERWMASKHHRENILAKQFEEMGIGIVKHPDKNEWFITQVFGTLQK